MRKTYLIFEDDRTGGKLRTATKGEWKQIMDRNKENPSLRRYFIEDIIIDGWEVDRMYIETDKATYDQWHRNKQGEYRKKKRGAGQEKVQLLSIDDYADWREEDNSIDCFSDGIDWETLMLDDVYVSDIRQTLSELSDWAVTMFDFLYRSDGNKSYKYDSRLFQYADLVGISYPAAFRRRAKMAKYLKMRGKIH